MASKDSLPVIDISPFLSKEADESSKVACAKQLHSACADVGFFYLIGHGVLNSTTDEVLELARKFFREASASEKQAIARRDPGEGHGDGARGYQKIGENVTGGKKDFHEAIDLFSEGESIRSFPPYELLMGRNIWPSEPAALRSRCEDYIEEMKRVGTAVVRAMGWALSTACGDLVDKEIFVKATTKSFWVFRLIGYPPLPRNNGESHLPDASEFSCGEHTDYGCVTLLLADSTRGALQVQKRDGTWIDVDPMEGAYVVNIGDMMERWTSGMWQSTRHRVIHRSDSYRVSAPFFFEPDFDAVVAPLEPCVAKSGKTPELGAVVYGQHLLRKISTNFG